MKLVLALLIGAAAWGQGANSAPPAEDRYANLPAQSIGANDLLSVNVYNAPELSKSVRVDPDGFIRLPMMKQKIKVEGLMPVEVETSIQEALKHEQILVDPYVTVNMAEYKSRPISVMGAVKTPLTFQADGVITLLDALARANGLADGAGSEILVTRMQPNPNGDSTALVQRIPVKALIDQADPEMNVKLHGGEEVRVPTVGKVFVLGNVRSPGAFLMNEAADTTLLKAVAMAGGLSPLATKMAYIIRQDNNGTKNEIPVELGKIMDRKAPDATLVANDILYIPDAKGKRAALAALEKMLIYGSGASSAVIYGTMH